MCIEIEAASMFHLALWLCVLSASFVLLGYQSLAWCALLIAGAIFLFVIGAFVALALLATLGRPTRFPDPG